LTVIGTVVALAALSACSSDKNEKISTIYEMKARPTDRNKDAIRERLTDPDRDVRATALNALVTLGVPDAADVARQGLEDPDGFVRATAAKLLGDVADRRDVEALTARLVADRDPIVRRRAAEALEAIGGPAAVDGLSRGLADPIEEVRLVVVRGLRRLDPGYALAELSRLAIEDPNYEVRVQAVRALGETGAPEVVAVLDLAIQDENEFVRAATAHARELHAKAAIRAPLARPVASPSPPEPTREPAASTSPMPSALPAGR